MIKIAVEATIYSELLELMRNNDPFSAPSGTFYLLNSNTVPYYPRPTQFRVTTDRVGQTLKVFIDREEPPGSGVSTQDLPTEYDLAANQEESVFSIQLGYGRNKLLIQTQDGQDPYQFNVYVNDIMTIWVSFLRDFYTNVLRKIQDQKNAIYSLYATRLAEPFLPIQDLLPEIQSLRTLATRLSLMSLIHSPGTNEGISDICKALTLSTPIFNDMERRTDDLDPDSDPWTNLTSQFFGSEAHVWIPNYGIMKWVALIKFLSANPTNYQLAEVSEHQVRFFFQGKLRTHSFDLDKYGSDFIQSLARVECFKNVTVTLYVDSRLSFRMKAASYTLDLVLENPVGNARLSLDRDTPFDQNLPFDSDTVDPFSDGWIGISLSGRFEQMENQQFGFDSFVCHTPPHYDEAWVYDSYFTRALTNTRYDIPLNINVSVSGTV